MNIPTVSDINDNRMLRFKNKINETLASKDLSIYQQLVDEFESETDIDPKLIAAALAYMMHGDKGMLLTETKGEVHERNKGIKTTHFDQADGYGKAHSRSIRQPYNDFIDPTPVAFNYHPEIAMERYSL